MRPGHHDGGGAPAWTRDAVVYQVFVDRFANGRPELDPPNVVPWGSKPTARGVMGGDLPGIIARLDYLVDLGVTVLYLTPIFHAPSNHRYDTYDYERIDPRLGTLEDFRDLVRAVHARGLRIVIDGVFNHCGRGFYPFLDVMENGDASPYLDWFTVEGTPVDAYGTHRYRSWQGVASMPEFDLSQPAVSAYLIAVAERWTREGVDGWRLDAVPHARHRSFWRALTRRIRAVNPEAWLIGEIWEDAAPWLDSGAFDGATDYPLRELVLAGVVDRSISIADFASGLEAQLRRRSPARARSMWTLLGSHDTPRLATLAAGTDGVTVLAFHLHFFLPGVPALYYGDELGLEGGPDPDNRRAMPWDRSRWNLELREGVQKLVALRRRSPALQCGDWQTLAVDEERSVCAFIRRHPTEVAILVLHLGSDQAEIELDLGAVPLPSVLTDALEGTPYRVRNRRLDLGRRAPNSGLILLAAGDSPGFPGTPAVGSG